MSNDVAGYADELVGMVKAPGFVRATLGGAQRLKKDRVEKVVLRMVELREGRRLQVSRFDGRKDLTSNHRVEEAGEALAELMEIGFSNVHVTMDGEEMDLRLTKKGEVVRGGRKRVGAEKDDAGAGTESGRESGGERHNRVKIVPLPEGKEDRLLEAMGVVDRMGRVRPTMRGKFTQINEFLKLLEPVLGEVKGSGAGGDDGEIVILDCGCGASYLTLAAWHYLNEVKGIRSRVIGVDVNEEVVEKSLGKARELLGEGAVGGTGRSGGLEFRAGRIGKLEDVNAVIVLALHACDTATDDALAQGIKSGAKVIVAVPCCHKELNGRLRVEGLEPIHRHGILHQRFADIVTDAFRAMILRVMGYRAEVMEFVSPEHTARNVMIRAVKVREGLDEEAMREYRAFRERMAVTPYLERAVGLG